MPNSQIMRMFYCRVRGAALAVVAAPAVAYCSESWPAMRAGDGRVSYHPDGTLRGVGATLNYQTQKVTKVVTRRDALGSDATLEGAEWTARSVEIENGRSESLSLRRNGFELVVSPVTSASGVNYYDQESIVSSYFPHCEDIVQAATGATLVAAFDYNVRSAAGCRAGRRLEGGSQVQDPAPIVHGDYTHASAPRRVAMLAKPPKLNDVLRGRLGERPLLSQQVADDIASGKRRFGIVNVWRPITPQPVQLSPLACCDAASTDIGDLVTFEIHYADRVGENYFARPSPRHRWLYFPHMANDEAMLIKQWDSAGDLARRRAPDAPDATGESTFALHSAFADPTSPEGAPDRESIEVRCLVVY